MARVADLELRKRRTEVVGVAGDQALEALGEGSDQPVVSAAGSGVRRRRRARLAAPVTASRASSIMV